MMAASSLNLEPIESPMPALFSRISHVSSGVWSSTQAIEATIWPKVAAKPAPRWLPTWKMTPLQPIREERRMSAIRASTDLSRCPGVLVPRFTR
jgi:hypothetical protein